MDRSHLWAPLWGIESAEWRSKCSKQNTPSLYVGVHHGGVRKGHTEFQTVKLSEQSLWENNATRSILTAFKIWGDRMACIKELGIHDEFINDTSFFPDNCPLLLPSSSTPSAESQESETWTSF